ncbi:MAG: FtsX-like permease family protein [Dyella sp.]
MSWHPMLSSLRRHKLTVTLLLLQVAFTCAILCNAIFLIDQRLRRIAVISGLDEKSLSVVAVVDRQAGENPLSVHQADLAALRAIPGVLSAAIVSDLPLSGDQTSSGACGSLEAVDAAMRANSIEVHGCAVPEEYAGGVDVLRTLGLKLVAGRDFRADEYLSGKPGQAVSGASAVIVSQMLARRLFGEAQVIGQSLYTGDDGFHGKGVRIVGVVEHLARGNLLKGEDNDEAIVLPVAPADTNVNFILRSRPEDRARVLKAAIDLLGPRVPEREVAAASSRTYAQMRSDYFRHDTTMIGLLLVSALGLLFVTALGIAGLASFWVQQRRRSIGIRRAIGARHGDILRYFQTENFLIVGAGIVLGMVLALALSLALMHEYEVPRLPLFYLPIGAVAMWLLGQLAVLGPARRAAAVPPVVATRSA